MKQFLKSYCTIFNWLPKPIRFMISSIALNLIIFSFMRLIFFFVFNQPQDVIPLPVWLKSFFIGFKFDVRLAFLIHLPLVLFSWVPSVNISSSIFGRRFWVWYLVIVNTVVLLFYFTDFGYYEYLEIRLDADILRFLYDPGQSVQMVRESYPVILIIALLLLLIISYGFIIKLLISKIEKSADNTLSKWKKVSIVSLSVTIYIFGIYGKFSYYPLRWCDAYFSTYSYASEVALNPVLHFFDTYKNKGVKYDIDKVKYYYSEIAELLQLPDKNEDSLNYTRPCCKSNTNFKHPNIVMIFLESFAYYKTGISNNPLDPTPNFDALSKKSLFFKRFYTPHSGTARSVFAALTGIPDIELRKTSSRNPLTVKQYTIVNCFKGYEKMYFLGGSASWGNIRGLLAHNIPGLKIYEEGSYSAPRVDVWGINDLQLLEEANAVFKTKENQPFFAIIQTSGNHKPYTIPKDNKGFKVLSPDKDVTLYGFRSIPAYNSFRFLDHSLGYFFNIAKKEKYYNNTIFILFGDHGLKRNAIHMHNSENQLTLTRFHVPFVIYAPGLIKEGRVFNTVASEVDLLPTIAGLASAPCINSTFGRNLLCNNLNSKRYAFTIRHSRVPRIGLISDRFYFLVQGDGTRKRLHEIYSDNPRENISDRFPEITDKMEKICFGMYETSRYIRFHNSPENIRDSMSTIEPEK